MKTGMLVSFIRKKNELHGEGTLSLGKWTVAVVGKRGASTANLQGYGDVTLQTRGRYRKLECGSADIKALVSRRDFVIDVPDCKSNIDYLEISKKRECRKVFKELNFKKIN